MRAAAPRKRQFGQWMQAPLGVLARLKFLRSTPFDPFGYATERRHERDLIGWYEVLIGKIIERMLTDSPDRLLALASAPMEIRGFGPVKAASIKVVKERVEELLDA
jgi:indolepyruvate ferredoxin oxidoreductase